MKINWKLKVFGIILFALLASIIIPMAQECGFKRNRRFNTEFVKNVSFIGTVESSFRDRDNHMIPTIIIRKSSNRQVLTFPNDKSGLFDYIQEGDSIFKAKGSLQCRVLRDTLERIFEIDFSF
jgi:hypothetical protein